MNKKYDWDQVEQFFMTAEGSGRISLKEVGERFNIPYQTVRRHASTHDWHSKRYRAWIKREHGMEFEDHLKAVYQEAMDRG
ncbi:hypothetical protein [Domibacillus tundrae]|uniref:hypothetical protein n=1 Tax=Domibacillus tundrae TaxID=1587527 RepID=UPI000617F7D6|nr:hypothetical protein [Domibacillus tundrae]